MMPAVASDDSPSRHRRANTLGQLLPLVTGYGLAFISTPIVVSSLGLRAFGIWAVTGAIAQYGALLDLGIGRAITRFVALHRARGDHHREAQVVATSLSVIVTLALLLLAGAWFVAPALRSSLSFTSDAQARTVFTSAVAILGCGLVSQGLAAASFGKGRMVKGNIADAMTKAATVLGGLAALLVDTDLATFAAGNAIGAVVGLSLAITYLVLFDDGIPLARPSLAIVREQLTFGAKGQLQMVSELIVFQADKVVVGLVVGPRAAGAYELGNRLALATRAVAVMAGNSLTAELTHEFARGGVAAVRAKYLDLTRVTTGLCLLPLLLVAATGPALLQAWLGRSPSLSITVVTALCVCFTLNAATAVTTASSIAIGRPGLPAIYGWVAAGVNIVLVVPLTMLLDAPGVLIATAVGILAGSSYGFAIFSRLLDVPRRDILRALDAYAVGLPVALLVGGVARLLDPGSRLVGCAVSAGLVGLFVALYVPIGIRRGFLPRLRRS
jgi:O-antigen/teichoic acid export membrane protein